MTPVCLASSFSGMTRNRWWSIFIIAFKMKMKIQVDLLIPFNYHAIDGTTATSLWRELFPGGRVHRRNGTFLQHALVLDQASCKWETKRWSHNTTGSICAPVIKYLCFGLVAADSVSFLEWRPPIMLCDSLWATLFVFHLHQYWTTWEEYSTIEYLSPVWLKWESWMDYFGNVQWF